MTTLTQSQKALLTDMQAGVPLNARPTAHCGQAYQAKTDVTAAAKGLLKKGLVRYGENTLTEAGRKWKETP